MFQRGSVYEIRYKSPTGRGNKSCGEQIAIAKHVETAAGKEGWLTK